MGRIKSEERLTISCKEAFDFQYKTDPLKQFIHIANERDTKVIKTKKGYVSPRGAMFKRMGVRKGVPDVFIPSTGRSELYAGLWIELKVETLTAKGFEKPQKKRSYPTPQQRRWLLYFARCSYAVAVVWNVQEFMDYCRDFYAGDIVICPYFEQQKESWKEKISEEL